MRFSTNEMQKNNTSHLLISDKCIVLYRYRCIVSSSENLRVCTMYRFTPTSYNEYHGPCNEYVDHDINIILMHSMFEMDSRNYRNRNL